ncbi:MAG TPA: MaoC/PaaZ C-terminal domain-containing protein [Ktedonobacteraceae bacterium]|nr:MaoC/PaaZ C-terminal domain-containing protein [Ktedonobacteraceae bacterium]
MTGDYNPYHIDDTFVQSSWFGRRIIPGLLTISMITHIGGMVGFLASEMHFQYLAPVYTGDTITCTVTFSEKDLEKRLFHGIVNSVNQDGVEVLKATLFPTFRCNPS